jgi:hypothetical protein
VLYFSDNSGSKDFNFSDLKAILELFWYKNELDSDDNKSISIARSIFSWLNAVIIFRFNMSVSCFISSFLVWLLDGREGLGDDEIEGGENGVRIIDYEDFFFINYADRGAVSPYSVNFVVDIATAEIASTYWFWICRINSGSSFNSHS